MEEKLLELFKLADKLYSKQNKVFAEINYSANKTKTIEVSIRTKEHFKYIEKCKFETRNMTEEKWNEIVKLFDTYVGRCSNE